MSRMERKSRVTPTSVKIPENLLRFIDDDVITNGDFSNRTDWIVTALRSYVDYRTELLYKKQKIFDKTDETNKKS